MNSSIERGDIASLYIDLMKRILTNDIYDAYEYLVLSEGGDLVRGIFTAQTRVIGDIEKEFGRVWPPTRMAHTMIGRRRLDNIEECIRSVIADNVPGDFIETGVWRGGATIFMRACLKALGDTGRKVWVADSFEGLPPPNDAYPADKGDMHHTIPELAVTEEQVKKNFRLYGLLDDQVEFLKGWFSDTLISAPISTLSIVRLDGDMYSSTIDAIEALYPRLSPGGYLIVDDYCLKPCAQAIHDYRDQHGINEKIIDIDGTGVYWRKN